MITEIVLWKLPAGMSREAVIAKYRASVPTWRANPELIRKSFLYDDHSGQIGAVYLWKSIDAAKKAHGPDFQDRIASNFAAKPEFQYFETPIVIDNATQQVIDLAA